MDTVNLPTAIIDPINRLFNDVAILKNLYTTNNGGCGANFDPYVAPFYLDLEEETLEAMVYPNPTNKDVFVKVLDAGQFHVQVVDIHGHQVYNNERYLNGEAIDTEQ